MKQDEIKQIIKKFLKEGKYLDNPTEDITLVLNLSNYERNQLENLIDTLNNLGEKKLANKVKLYIQDNF